MFPCEKCGCCCRKVGEVFFAKYLALSDGSCKHLDQNSNLCKIYDQRPIFCRVDEFYDQKYSSEMSREEFYKINKELCKKFQDEFFKRSNE
ncbi:MAG: YkgJ family cysteine cluster protein [Selenomonadaceae bacterium]|nr:YkgJ family cysteine cluster protein [Selenomonadaceae bacterium]